MLDRRSNNVLARLIRGRYRAKKREVVGFRASTCEYDFRRLRADKFRNRIASCIYRGTSTLSIRMNRAHISKILGKIWQHRFQDLAVHGCRSIVIKIDVHGGKVKYSE